MEALGKIIKSRDMSLETKAKIIHTLIFPSTMYRCESWTVKKADIKKWFIWNMVLEESTMETLDHRKDEQVGPSAH